MTLPLMPKATAGWLVDNTSLTFKQIADFCGMHALEVQAIADGDIASHIMGLDPVANGQLSREEIERCEKDSKAELTMLQHERLALAKKKGAKYTSYAQKAARLNAIAWLIKEHPELNDMQIVKLIRTTRPTIDAIRNKTHSAYEDLKPENPVILGLCSAQDLERALAVAVKIIPTT